MIVDFVEQLTLNFGYLFCPMHHRNGRSHRRFAFAPRRNVRNYRLQWTARPRAEQRHGFMI